MAGASSRLSTQSAGYLAVILVTVGTGAPFESLLREVDRLASEGFFQEPIVCQGGRSMYKMQNAEQFVARPSIQDLIDQSSMVFTHGGATVVQLLVGKKNFVAFPNPSVADDHQTSFLRQIEKIASISWSSDVKELATLYRTRQKLGPPQLHSGIPRAADIVAKLLLS